MISPILHLYMYMHWRMKGVRMSNTQLSKLYKSIVRCEQRDGPPRPSAHHVTGRFKNKIKSLKMYPGAQYWDPCLSMFLSMIFFYFIKKSTIYNYADDTVI